MRRVGWIVACSLVVTAVMHLLRRHAPYALHCTDEQWEAELRHDPRLASRLRTVMPTGRPARTPRPARGRRSSG